ncbi:MAG: hypothetical protein ABTB30_14505, partial [Clostridia bacterium]
GALDSCCRSVITPNSTAPSGISFRTIAVISLVLPAVLDIAMYAFLHSSAAQKRWDRVGQ